MTAALHVPANPVRVVTAAALFDGHDAAINVMRRILQAQGAEVVHLGHNRSVDEVVKAAVEEDVAAVAVSSYQGGHVEYFEYLVERLAAEGRGDVRVYGGGGGVIVPQEVERLAASGVRIFTPGDGQRLGLARMVNTIVAACDAPPDVPAGVDDVLAGSTRALARTLTAIELGALDRRSRDELDAAAGRRAVPVLGITGTGGSGKSSLTDELVLRLRLDLEDKVRVAVIAVDPTRRRAGGALLGDRIRMNSIDAPHLFFRSVATRSAVTEVPPHVETMVSACKAAGFDLVVVETPGIGQGDSAVVDLSDVSLYVMTPEYGAASQLEKIDMLDYADVVAINKFERRGAEDALREVRRQVTRNREAVGTDPGSLPVFGTVAARFNDDGVTALYQHLRDLLAAGGLAVGEGTLAAVPHRVSTGLSALVPGNRTRYLAEIAEAVRGYRATTAAQVAAIRAVDRLEAVRDQLATAGRPTGDVDDLLASAARDVLPATAELLRTYEADAVVHSGDDRPARPSLAGNLIPRIALPRTAERGELVRFLRAENLPGRFPFTGGVFPTKRDDEDPTRMFAGEGGPARTNARFHRLAEGQPATRLSTAFDSVTLYGADPDERPDIYGKIGNSGVSVATLDDMKLLYDGFDLVDPSTSVSMTINGPAPAILAMFLNAAIDQHPELDPAEVLRRVRGTVQADILKEDQGQNTCVLSTQFALRMMADIQEWFVGHDVRRFYSVSISGYHIAEAGANPISQLAFTLANGFTYVEAYRARGMRIDDFAPNLSFFFSNGMDPEYTVLGRVARRIWAIALRDRYGASERSQKLKYHVQTSGRSLHAQEMAFNDIRTTLQALCAVYDNANSLHTNAYDEAITTPTDESVRRAMAIQLIINREWGLALNDNPLQGSFVVDELTDLVEEAVLAELERISERGGVLGAMETGYQRGRIQDESMLYEQRKHDGTLPIIGVNTFRPADDRAVAPAMELRRSTDEEKQEQLHRLRDFQARHANERDAALDGVRRAALDGTNTFDALMHAVRHCTLAEITSALYEVGGRYRRNV
ncbi:MAG TPA: fused isobutyryl-CoA mutase/GTPase IcmF [Acidimicrobiales bacterium]|nr:fused isobutyryl-CoA mutase/GTPase IcmF [Acidimicrobiales bacterium]